MVAPAPKLLRISYEAVDFPPGTLANGTGDLSFSWDELLWATVTLGRPSLADVFKHGVISQHEAVFRWSMVRMALEQSGPSAHRLRRTQAFKELDPTEKGAVTYFLGMVFCKLFAARMLNAPWLLHLDVFRASLNPTTMQGRSRPDLVGQATGSGDWYAFESKGRSSPPSAVDKAKAKAQAVRLVSVGSKLCALHIGAFTYFKNDRVQFFWRDPPAQERNKIELQEPDKMWSYYYAPFVEQLRRSTPDLLFFREGKRFFSFKDLDIAASIHPKLAELLNQGDWSRAHEAARELCKTFVNDGYQPDGLAIRSGESWKRRLNRTEA